MAEGGVPLPCLTDISSSEVADNLQEQNDEILALQSIFEGDKERIRILSTVTGTGSDLFSDDSDVGNMLQIFVPVKKTDGHLIVDVYQPIGDEVEKTSPEKSGVSYSRSESGQRAIWSCEVNYLSPLCLHVTLPVTYPSQDPPSFVLSCIWLSPWQLTVLCQELDRLWLENKPEGLPGMPVLYTWTDWLQEHILSVLGLTEQISVTVHIEDEDVTDCRVLVDNLNIDDIVTDLLRYNREQQLQEFFRADHECGICFETDIGSKFFLISECQHHMCKACMETHCQLLVKEGTVQNLRCPNYKCKSTIPQYMLKQVLTGDQFQRYETLTLQKGLDIMGDIVWCPRCESAVIREPEQHLQLAHCVACFFSFCPCCLERWHQGEACPIDRESIERKKREIARELAAMKAKTEDERETLRQKLLHLEQDRQSYSYINEWASKCPHCSARIMKVSGCNKVVCTVCCKSMCWVCKRLISGYQHFADNPHCNTFGLNRDDDIDNTDMHGQRFGYVYPNAQPAWRRPPPRISEGRLILDQLKADPALQDKVILCPSCKQRNLQAENGCNHIRCWNCKASSCFACKCKIVGPVGKHFSGLNSCPQHS